MNRNTVYAVVGALCVVIAVIGYQLYQERTQREGIDIQIGERGLTIQQK